MGIKVEIRFYEELNDFLKVEFRKKTLVRELNHQTTVKDLIESFGVPHTEVDLILVNGVSVGFEFQIHDQDLVSVYPVFESLDISEVTRLQERPLRDLKFIADNHLGRLAGKLRLLGLDVVYCKRANTEELLAAVTNERRVLLSRNRRLLMRKVIDRGYLVRSQLIQEQVREVIERFDLLKHLKPFTRCALCNGILERVVKEKVLQRLEPKTRKYFFDFFQCQNCGQVYWQGSHVPEINALIDSLHKPTLPNC